MTALPEALLISSLVDGYRAKSFSPTQVVEQVLARITRAPEMGVWITLLARERILEYAAALERLDPDLGIGLGLGRGVESLPLYGVPFAIKDNIDLEGVPTTAGCPDYTYVPAKSAFVVERLIQAGAIPIGKTNLDQFATGLVGTRSPYGACRNSFDPAYISGGSSSGSAVAVAKGLVSFSLGTDTAGSGRVPAAFNNIIGLKPTCGALSTTGVVPACRSLDCVSIFALTAGDASRVYAAAAAFDPEDGYSRPMPPPVSRVTTALSAPVLNPATPAGAPIPALEARFRFGVPRPDQLEFFGDTEYRRLFEASVRQLESLGGRRVEIDFEPFCATARLLYDGAWVAERYCAVGDFLERHPQSLHPVTRQIISAGRNLSAADAFRSQYRLMELRRATEHAWQHVDFLLTPTAGTIYPIAAVEADPVRLNSNLGYYTNFVNLLDLAAIAVPAGFRSDGLPFGVTLLGRAGADAQLLCLADRLHRTTASPDPTNTKALQQGEAPGERISVAVCGAHMEGLPLNHQLTGRGALLLSRTRTAAVYKFYALPGGPPYRPGLVRACAGGASIEVEVWSVPAALFGSFVAGIPAPLGIGKVELQDGTQVCGFLCEPYAISDATDITSLGTWRRYVP